MYHEVKNVFMKKKIQKNILKVNARQNPLHQIECSRPMPVAY